MVWLAGGPSTIDMWDLKPDAPDEIRGDFRPIATHLEGVSICEHLPLLAGIMNRVTLVRSLTHEINDHSVGSRYLMTGNRPSTSTEFPSLGSVASRMLPGQAGVPSYVSMAESAGPWGRLRFPGRLVQSVCGQSRLLRGATTFRSAFQARGPFPARP